MGVVLRSMPVNSVGSGAVVVVVVAGTAVVAVVDESSPQEATRTAIGRRTALARTRILRVSHRPEAGRPRAS
jgi:hypothetical protein